MSTISSTVQQTDSEGLDEAVLPVKADKLL